MKTFLTSIRQNYIPKFLFICPEKEGASFEKISDFSTEIQEKIHRIQQECPFAELIIVPSVYNLRSFGPIVRRLKDNQKTAFFVFSEQSERASFWLFQYLEMPGNDLNPLLEAEDWNDVEIVSQKDEDFPYLWATLDYSKADEEEVQRKLRNFARLFARNDSVLEDSATDLISGSTSDLTMNAPPNFQNNLNNQNDKNRTENVKCSDIKILSEPFVPRWYPIIDRSRCINCLECVNFCLFGVYSIGNLGQLTFGHSVSLSGRSDSNRLENEEQNRQFDQKIAEKEWTDDCSLVDQPDACRNGCPACSRVCPAQAILFPKYNDDFISGRRGIEKTSFQIENQESNQIPSLLPDSLSEEERQAVELRLGQRQKRNENRTVEIVEIRQMSKNNSSVEIIQEDIENLSREKKQEDEEMSDFSGVSKKRPQSSKKDFLDVLIDQTEDEFF